MEEEIFKIAENIGYIVGKYGNDEEVQLLNKFLEDCKYRIDLIKQLKVKNKELEKMVDEMAEHIVSSAVVDDTVCAIKFCEIEEDCTYEKMLECTKQYFKKKASEENG